MGRDNGKLQPPVFDKPLISFYTSLIPNYTFFKLAIWVSHWRKQEERVTEEHLTAISVGVVYSHGECRKTAGVVGITDEPLAGNVQRGLCGQG